MPWRSTICPGPMRRREFLRAGLAGFGSLTLPGLLRMRADAATLEVAERTAVILVWLPGGPSHLETYDPKPNAPSEYRGPYSPILFAGGGITGGQVIGATDARGEDVIDRRVGRGDFVATMYHHLGIEPDGIAFKDFAGRPVPILPEGGRPIDELAG